MSLHLLEPLNRTRSTPASRSNALSQEPHSPQLRRTVVLGVLGGIASGKSRVAQLLAGPAGRVIDADRLVDEVYRDPTFLAELLSEFGPSALTTDGTADRRELGRIAFAQPEKRRWLEARIHPAVRQRIAAELEAARDAGVPRIVLDVPLLLENDAAHGLVSRCDHLVFVDSTLAERENRAARNRGWPLGEVARRERAQLPLEEKRRRAHAIVANFDDADALAREVRRVERELGLDSPT